MIYKNITAPFNINQIENFVVLANEIKKNGLTVDEFIELHKQEKVLMNKRLIEYNKDKKFPFGKKRTKPTTRTNTKNKCSKCGKKLIVVPVNHHPGAMIGGDFTIATFCKHGCLDTQYY